MTKYYVPKSMEIVDGFFSYGQTITISVDGKIVKRKVHYGSLDGEYIVFQGIKYGLTDMDKK